MRLKRIYKQGKVIDGKLYNKLQRLDFNVFAGCNNEFKSNRDWWVIVDSCTNIIAYCGCLYTDGICIFVRAWVSKWYRGKGIQRRMILTRLKAALNAGCSTTITYTTYDNYVSANNLIRCGFKLYNPANRYAGNVNYFKRTT